MLRSLIAFCLSRRLLVMVALAPFSSMFLPPMVALAFSSAVFLSLIVA